MSLECMSIDLAGRTLESPLTNAEITGFRCVVGQLLWFGQQPRPDLCVGVSLAAQRLSKATLSDVKTLNKLVEQAKNTAEMGIVIPCGVVLSDPHWQQRDTLCLKGSNQLNGFGIC